MKSCSSTLLLLLLLHLDLSHRILRLPADPQGHGGPLHHPTRPLLFLIRRHLTTWNGQHGFLGSPAMDGGSPTLLTLHAFQQHPSSLPTEGLYFCLCFSAAFGAEACVENTMVRHMPAHSSFDQPLSNAVMEYHRALQVPYHDLPVRMAGVLTEPLQHSDTVSPRPPAQVQCGATHCDGHEGPMHHLYTENCTFSLPGWAPPLAGP